MMPMPRRSTVVVFLGGLVAALVVATGPTRAQVVKPFRITGQGIGPNGLPLPGQAPRTHWVVGNATELGMHTGIGTVQTNSAAFNPLTGSIEGQFGGGSPFLFYGDGAVLATWYGRVDHGASSPGSVELQIVGVTPNGALIVKAFWIAEFVVDPKASTGRLAGTTGSWIMYAQSDPFVLGSSDPVAYTWEGQGFLTFRSPGSPGPVNGPRF